MKLISLAATAVAVMMTTTAAFAAEATVNRLYVLDCGHTHLLDQARFISPGVNVGQPIDLLNSCYLMRHGKHWLIWDTGHPDAITGQPPNSGPIQSTRTITLAAQLQKLGVKPTDIKYVVISHTHSDHSGNVDLFQGVPVLMQKAEYDAAFAPV